MVVIVKYDLTLIFTWHGKKLLPAKKCRITSLIGEIEARLGKIEKNAMTQIRKTIRHIFNTLAVKNLGTFSLMQVQKP